MTDTETPALDYRIPAGCCDELRDEGGRPLPRAASLMAALKRLGPDALQAAGKRRDTIFMQQGITFEVAGSDGERRDRAWPLDLVPRVLTAAEWTTIKRGLAQRIRALNRFEYRQGATYVDSRVIDLLEAGAGVCQDFVHLGLALLRRHGIAARYVSGYLFAAGSGDGQESVEVDTHAWLEALLPVSDPAHPDPVWVGADPTNRVLAGETHVKIGHGRHYADVPPIKGVFRGSASAKLTASVTMTRLERTDPASIARS